MSLPPSAPLPSERPADAPPDLMTDPLASAALSPSQRAIWDHVRSELIIARSKLLELEERVRQMDHPTTPDVKDVLSQPDFNREVARMLAFDERYGGVSSVLYFDIDNMTDVAKAHPRTVVDAMVRTIGGTLAENTRRVDILGRLALDEFGVLLTRCDNASAWKKAEALAIALEEALGRIDGLVVKPEVTFGAYTFKENENVSDGLRKAAKNTTAQKPLPQ
jgi:diguanylate cyclase (GGDEF)-like protein